MRAPFPLLLLALSSLAACAHASRERTFGGRIDGHAAFAELPPPCTTVVPDADLFGWRAVTAEGFTFCVPRTWRGSALTWWHGSSTLEWRRGVPPASPSLASADGPPVSAGGASTPLASSSAPSAFGAHGSASVVLMDQLSETIGGYAATLVRVRTDAGVQALAQWTDLHLYAVGRAPDTRSADTLMLVYRTLRRIERR